MSQTLKVLAYNVFLRPTTLFGDGQKKRAELLPDQIRQEHDLIIFSETFDDGARKILLEGLTGTYPYRTQILGRDRFLEQDGGVIMVSRWPIVAEAQFTFGDICDGSDCKADKGVLYACIQKKGVRTHFFGSHTNAGDGSDIDKVKVRGRQFQIIKAFIDAQNIPATEAVIIGGDLNVDRIAFDEEYRAMLQTLSASDIPIIGSLLYSIDPSNNDVTDPKGRQQLLDYVLTSEAHLKPQFATNQVRVVKTDSPWFTGIPGQPFIGPQSHLSDHHAVQGRFDFPLAAQTVAAVNYRSVIRLEHFATEYALHSHLINYGHPNSSGQQQVTCFGGADDNDWWIVKGPDDQPQDFGQGQGVPSGAVVRLEHQATGANLHSHAGFPPPVTDQQEVTGYGAGGLGDGNDNWRVEVEGGGPWETGKRVRLIHTATDCALHSHRGFSHPQWTENQQEVTGFPGRDDNDWWMASLRAEELAAPPVMPLVPSPECQALFGEIAKAEAEIRDLQEQLRVAATNEKGALAGQIRMWQSKKNAAVAKAKSLGCPKP